MPKAYYESSREPLESGFRVTYVTAPGGYHPAHWHEEVEILFHLNGDSDITIEKKKYHLQPKHMIVIDSRQVHSTFTHDPTSMFICIHISRQYMEKYLPDLELYQFRCTPEDVNDENFQEYLDTCLLLQKLARVYFRTPVTLAMETEGYVLQIFARIILYFSHPQGTVPASADQMTAERIRNVITYVAAHYQESVRVQDVADLLGFSKEYFCRFFKKVMGMSFLRYLNEVRAAHVYQDLETTNLSVAEIMEQNGFTNQKLFNRIFKEIYGCTPLSVKTGNPSAAAEP